MNKLKIEYVSLDDINTYENNAKLHPAEQIEQIKKSIQEFGFNDPIAIDENNVIIEGHGRYIACKELGINDLHPTMKPVRMCSKLIRNSTRPGEIVLDLFGGSGSTLMACEQLDRKCLIMEYDPVYADTIIKRWEQFTGQKAVLLNG